LLVRSLDTRFEEFQREGGLLTGLRKYTNYTVSVAALTKAGLGSRTGHVHCTTNEDGKEIFLPLILQLQHVKSVF
jgi:hypothetical protein